MREEDLSVQILAQTSENIQKLFDLSTRIDERVKSIQHSQQDMDSRIEGLLESHTGMLQRLAVLESKNGTHLQGEINELEKTLNSIDKRLSAVEHTSSGNEDRWKTIFNFIIQLVWIVIAAWVLFKLNLNPPPVP